MSNYQLWQIEKFGNALPETQPQELDESNFESKVWMENEAELQLIEKQ